MCGARVVTGIDYKCVVVLCGGAKVWDDLGVSVRVSGARVVSVRCAGCVVVMGGGARVCDDLGVSVRVVWSV